MVLNTFTPDPSTQAYQPFTGMEGIPQLGGGPVGLGAQMLLQNVLQSAMGNMGMAPTGVSDQNLYDRLMHQRFTSMHQDFVRDLAARDRGNYMRTSMGIAAMTGTPWGAEQLRAAHSLSSGIIQASPILTEIAPNYLDEFGGQRGSAAVMAHYASLGGRHRIDPVTGYMGYGSSQHSQKRFQELMGDVYDNMFAGDRYKDTSLSAGRAGQLFQEMQVRGLMPGAASLEMLERGRPDRFRNMMTAAGLDPSRSLGQLDPNEREQLMQPLQTSQELKSFDAKRISGSLGEWGKAVEAMREIFGDSGHPNAPMSTLINALNQLTGGGLSQLRPGHVAELVRNTYNLARNSGVGLSAAMVMTQESMGNAAAMGLNPVFGTLATQQTLAFTSAYQGLGMGSHQAWDRHDLAAQQQMKNQLVLSGAASSMGNQIGMVFRLQEAGLLSDGSDATRFLDAVTAGQTSFTLNDGTSLSTNLGGDNKLVDILARSSNGRLTAGQARMMLGQTQANSEFLARNPDALATIQRQQREDLIVREGPVGASIVNNILKEKLRGGFNPAEMRAVSGSMGEAGLRAFMDASGEVATNQGLRNSAIAEGMAQQVERQAANGDAGAIKLLQQYGTGDALRTNLGSMAEALYGGVDAWMQNNNMGTLQDRHVLHSEAGLREQVRAVGRAEAQSATAAALDSVGKGGMLRRGMEAVMTASPDDENTLLRVLATAMGGVDEKRLAGALQEKDLQNMRRIYGELATAQEDYSQQHTAAGRAAAMDTIREKSKAFTQEAEVFNDALDRAGLLTPDMLDRTDTGRAIRHSDYVLKQGAKLTSNEAQSQMRGTADIIAKYMSSRESLTRMGPDTMKQVVRLRDTMDEVHLLAQQKYGGDLQKAMASVEGRKLVGKQHALLADLDERLKSGKAFSYLDEKDSTENRDNLQRIATDLFDKKKSASGSIDSLLSREDKELDKLGLDEADLTLVKWAKKRRDAADIQAGDLQDAYAEEGDRLLKGSLSVLTGEATRDDYIERDVSGRLGRVQKFLAGSGTDADAGRAWLKGLTTAATRFHSGQLSKTEQEEARNQYGDLIDMFRQGTEDGGIHSRSELAGRIERQMEQLKDQYDTDKTDDGVVNMRFNKLVITPTDDGGADGTADRDGDAP